MKLPELVDRFREKGVFDGTVILAGNGKEDLFIFSRGPADRLSGAPFTADTVIDVSSVSKPVGTATALALCMERGWIDPDRCFTDYMPDFTGKLCAPVQVRHLAYHYSGLVSRYPLDCTAEEMLAAMKNSNSDVPPMTRYQYLCLNFHILGWIIERVSGQTLDVFAEENIFRPLGMNDTKWGAPLPHTRSRLARTVRHLETDPGMIFDRWARVLYPRICGNAGIFTSANDLAKFCRMMLARGRGFFKTGIAEEFFRNAAPSGMYERTLGWNQFHEQIPAGMYSEAVFHTGSSGQSVWIDPGKQLFLIILTNLFGEHDDGIRARFEMAVEVMKQL